MRRSEKGITLVELLIAMAVLGIVLVITSSGILQSLQVNRLTDEAANTQSKLRRISEVVTQELRSAVLGAVVNIPVESSSTAISFTLISGDGGLPVTTNPDRYRTGVFTNDSTALTELVGEPVLIIDGLGRTILVEEITGAIESTSELAHMHCAIDIEFPINTRVYAASAMGFSYDSEQQTLHQHTIDSHGVNTVPFAFELSRFELAYEYDAGGGNTQLLAAPRQTSGSDFPDVEFEDGGELYRLARLRLTLASTPEGSDLEREYVSYIEMTGIGNDLERQRTITEFIPCGSSLPEDPGPGEDPDPGGDPGGPGNGGDPGDPGDGDDGPGGPGNGGPGDDDDDDDDSCGKRPSWLC